MTTGRNYPCRCGSGIKYKKCHLPADEAEQDVDRPGRVSPLHDLDQKLVHEILELLSQRCPHALDGEVAVLDTHPEMSQQFAAPWLAYVVHFEERRGVDWFLEARLGSRPAGRRIGWRRSGILRVRR